MLLLLGVFLQNSQGLGGFRCVSSGDGKATLNASANVFDERTFLKAPGEGKMVPTSRVCLRVAFITISKSPAKEYKIPHDIFCCSYSCLIHTLLRLKSGPLLCNWPACTPLLTSLTFDLLELRFWKHLFENDGIKCLKMIKNQQRPGTISQKSWV